MSLLIVAIASVGVGYALATMLSNSRKESPPPTAVSEETVQNERRSEVFRLYRRPEGSGVQPEIGGHQPASADELTAEEHAAISIGLVDLYAWLERSTRPALTADAALQAREVADESMKRGVQPPPAASVKSTAAVRSLGINPFKSLKRTAQNEVSQKVSPPPASIAAQVDEILQGKLEARNLDGKSVRLMDLPNQGMVIMVGLEKYQDLEAVPDEELRGIIRESVVEWETRMLGGLAE